MVEILARFQVKGSVAATNLNFQVAVPKVSSPSFERGYKSSGGGFALFFFFKVLGRVADVASAFFSSITLTRHSNYKCNPCLDLTSTLEQPRLSKCALRRLLV